MFIFDEDWGEISNPYVPSEIDSVSNPNALYQSFLLSERGVTWKTPVQKYRLNLLSELASAHYSLEKGEYSPADPYEFQLTERGHVRAIKAVTIEDRVVQRSLNDNVLTPAISHLLIYDNGASQTGKGISFSRNRFRYHLNKAHINFGPSEGYILIIDFSKYFDNIIHSTMLKYLQPLVNNREFELIQKIFEQFKVDVSYMSDDEYASCLDDLFVALDYEAIDKKLLTKEKFMDKSVGIGNQMSQIAGIFYSHEIDNYCKIVKGIRCYGRYMDDTYAIVRTKQEAYQLLNEIAMICERLKIHLNQKKIRIQPLHNNIIRYLKINYYVDGNGRITETVPRETFDRERKRLVKFKNLLDTGKMPLIDILQAFSSWIGTYAVYKTATKDIEDMEYYFKVLFNLDTTINLHDLIRNMNEVNHNNMINSISII
jgi:RNA-directed DNA polymerase